jgi:hypothetical protein
MLAGMNFVLYLSREPQGSGTIRLSLEFNLNWLLKSALAMLGKSG